MHNYRQAALCLHGLARDDRQWLLSRLPERHRDTLSALLAELESLGIPGEANPLDFALEIAPRTDDAGSAEQEIERAGVDRIWVVLESESDAVIGALLSAREWAWKPAFIARLRKGYRNIALQDRAPAVKTYEALVQALAARLRARPASRQASQNAPLSKRLRRMLWQR